MHMLTFQVGSSNFYFEILCLYILYWHTVSREFKQTQQSIYRSWEKIFQLQREKESDLTRSYDKNPYTSRDVKSDNTNAQTSLITQLMRTDLGRSVGVTTARKRLEASSGLTAEGVPNDDQRGRRSGPYRLWGGLDNARHISKPPC